MKIDEAHDVLVFGGTFDPPHLAHVRLPTLVAHQLGCDCIAYIPARVNPLKQDTPPTADAHRRAMLSLAVAAIPNAVVSTVELEREGPSYMIDTLRELQRQAADHRKRWRLLIGADQAINFDQWRDWRAILEMVTPAVMLRPPWDRETLERDLAARFSPEICEKWRKAVVRVPAIDITATELRRRLRVGEPTNEWIDPAVLSYIAQNGLYG